jgi:hypothetical protein
MASIHNFAYVVINLISRVVSTGFGIDLTRTSVVWCKARQFCLFTLSLITLTCSCLAMIDQFFATSQSANLRRLSNIKWAHRIVIIVIILWCLHGIAPILFYDILPTTKTCGISNTGFSTYLLIFLFGLICAIPCSVMLIFGYLTYRNIHLTRVLAEQQADRQLVRMTLIQVVLVLISFIPYAINNAYGIVTSKITKDADRLAKESFASTIFNLVPYIYYAVCLFDLKNNNFLGFFFLLGKLLCIFDFIKSFSSSNKRSNIILAKT